MAETLNLVGPVTRLRRLVLMSQVEPARGVEAVDLIGREGEFDRFFHSNFHRRRHRCFDEMLAGAEGHDLLDPVFST